MVRQVRPIVRYDICDDHAGDESHIGRRGIGMPETSKYSLLLGGLSSAADAQDPGERVVPESADIEIAIQNVLRAPITVTGGHRDPSVSLGLGGDADQEWTIPRRYAIKAPPEIPTSELYAGLVHALLDVAPLPSGIVSNWTVRIALEDNTGKRVGNGTFEIPRGGGRRRFLSPSGMGGIALGALAGAALGGPVGVIIGAAIGGAAGEALERQFPSTPTPKPRRA